MWECDEYIREVSQNKTKNWTNGVRDGMSGSAALNTRNMETKYGNEQTWAESTSPRRIIASRNSLGLTLVLGIILETGTHTRFLLTIRAKCNQLTNVGSIKAYWVNLSTIAIGRIDRIRIGTLRGPPWCGSSRSHGRSRIFFCAGLTSFLVWRNLMRPAQKKQKCWTRTFLMGAENGLP